MFYRMLQCMVEQASEAGALGKCKKEDLPGVRKRISVRQGDLSPTDLLQSRLRQQSAKRQAQYLKNEEDNKTERKVIGVFPVFNTGGIFVHDIDYAEDRVLASINGENPEWCRVTEKPQSEMGGDSDELESGFLLGSFFVPFSEVMRV